MRVYVDDSQIPYGRMKMCHMLADTMEELHAMAKKIGVARHWFQFGVSTPHYDICLSKRKAAVAAGAIETDRRGLVIVIRRIRARRKP